MYYGSFSPGEVRNKGGTASLIKSQESPLSKNITTKSMDIQGHKCRWIGRIRQEIHVMHWNLIDLNTNSCSADRTSWLPVAGCGLPVAGCRFAGYRLRVAGLLVTGCGLLVTGCGLPVCWLPVNGELVTGHRKLATGHRKLATGNWQLANCSPETGNWQLANCSLETRNWQPKTAN